MERRTLEQLEAALNAISQEISPRVEELAQKSTEGVLSPDEREEYAGIVRLNDTLSLDFGRKLSPKPLALFRNNARAT